MVNARGYFEIILGPLKYYNSGSNYGDGHMRKIASGTSDLLPQPQFIHCILVGGEVGFL